MNNSNQNDSPAFGAAHGSALPCPFCGSTKITVEWESCPPLDKTDTNRRWFAECAGCSCQGPFCQKEPEVISAWNRRKSAVVSRLRDQLAILISRADYVCTHRYDTHDPVGTRIIAVSDLSAETQRARELLIATVREIPLECDHCGQQHYIRDENSPNDKAQRPAT